MLAPTVRSEGHPYLSSVCMVTCGRRSSYHAPCLPPSAKAARSAGGPALFGLPYPAEPLYRPQRTAKEQRWTRPSAIVLAHQLPNACLLRVPHWWRRGEGATLMVLEAPPIAHRRWKILRHVGREFIAFRFRLSIVVTTSPRHLNLDPHRFHPSGSLFFQTGLPFPCTIARRRSCRSALATLGVSSIITHSGAAASATGLGSGPRVTWACRDVSLRFSSTAPAFLVAVMPGGPGCLAQLVDPVIVNPMRQPPRAIFPRR